MGTLFRTPFTFALMTTGAFSQKVSKLFSELKLVTDNLLSICAIIYSWRAICTHDSCCTIGPLGSRGHVVGGRPGW